MRLRLVIDDDPNPPLAGRFDGTGADLGTLRVYMRLNADADTLATTLYHESLHLMRWLSRSAPGGDPRVFEVDGGEVALRRETSERITVEGNR